MSIIEINKINKSYGEKKVLTDFSVKIEAGEMVAIMGESGKGKSTILNIIGLIESIDSGSITIKGETFMKPNKSIVNNMLRNNINYLFQNFALLDNETVYYNLNLALNYVRCSKVEKKKLIKESLEKVYLNGYENRKIYELSGGEQQRVSVARAILKPGEIILADEPTGSLDEKNRGIILSLLKEINSQGKTIIIVTHDKYVSSMCHRVINI